MAAWLTGYDIRRKLTVNSALIDADLIDFPVDSLLSSANFDFAKSLPAGEDIRYTAADGITLLEYERERHEQANNRANYQIKLPTVSSATNTDFYQYQRNIATPDGANPTAVWDMNTMARWSLKEDPSGTAPQMKDSTVNANHGTAHGGMTSADSVEGKIGRALDFDGGNDYVDVPNTILPNPNAFSISGWFFNKGENATAEDWQIIVDLRGQYNIFVLSVEQDNATNPGAVQFHIFDGTTSYNLFSANLAINAWHLFTATWDGTTQRLYISDAEVGNQIATNPRVVSHLPQSRIGKDYLNTNRGWFNGLIDEVRIYNQALIAAEIKATFNTGNDTLLTYGAEEILFQPRGTSLGSPFIY